jgi:hypothetical protein
VVCCHTLDIVAAGQPGSNCQSSRWAKIWQSSAYAVILPRPQTERASAASLAECIGGALVENKTFQDQPIFAALSHVHENAICFKDRMLAHLDHPTK